MGKDKKKHSAEETMVLSNKHILKRLNLKIVSTERHFDNMHQDP